MIDYDNPNLTENETFDIDRCETRCFDGFLLDLCERYRLKTRGREYGLRLLDHFVTAISEFSNTTGKEEIRI